MVAVDFVKFETSSPGDVAGPLQGLQAAGYAPEDVVAIVGKTEGERTRADTSSALRLCCSCRQWLHERLQ